MIESVFSARPGSRYPGLFVLSMTSKRAFSWERENPFWQVYEFGLYILLRPLPELNAGPSQGVGVLFEAEPPLEPGNTFQWTNS